MKRWIEYELLDWEYLKERYGMDENGVITVPTASSITVPAAVW